LGEGLILDVGSGTGRFAKPLQQLGVTTVGVDSSKEMLRVAAVKRVKNLFVADARALPFKPKAFDSTVSVHLLHLVTYWKLVLAEIARVTKNNLLTVFDEQECLGVDPHKEYRRLAGRKFGYVAPHESDLIPFLTPLKLEHIATDIKTVNVLLHRMQKKSFSYQWNVPRSTHDRVMRGMEKFRGEKLTCKVYVCVWRISDVEEFLKK
jgi:ubiquinone/menaquinone biosynthesis C-methylase UbiE